MPKKRKSDSETTTISLRWGDKEKLRKLARPVKKTKHGTKYETDGDIFKRVINAYIESHPSEVGEIKSTYPELK